VGVRIIYLFFFFFLPLTLNASPDSWSPPAEFENITESSAVKLDIRYAGTNNFTGKNLYGDYHSCYLHKEAAAKFKVAVNHLKQIKPGYRFLIFDCLRPVRIQRILWKEVAGTSQEPYVANPDRGSIHNFGFAVDLTLTDQKGNELDMGTLFDSFSPLSEPRREKEFLKTGALKPDQVTNRKLLRSVMEAAGFLPLSNEWWHFDALSASEVRNHYKKVE
jgi:zinc D-Ala-D-Ala dipeptidase